MQNAYVRKIAQSMFATWASVTISAIVKLSALKDYDKKTLLVKT